MTSQDPGDSAPTHGSVWERLAANASELASAIRTAENQGAEHLTRLEQDAQQARDQARDQALALDEAVRAREDAEATRRLASEEAERLRRALEEASSQRDHERTSAIELRGRVATLEKELSERPPVAADSSKAEALERSLTEAQALLTEKAAALGETVRRLEATDTRDRETAAEIERLRQEVEELQQKLVEVTAERDTDRSLVAELRTRAETPVADSSAGAELAAARQALEERNRQAEAKAEALQRNLEDVTAERDLERGAATELRSRLEAMGTETERAEATDGQLAEARQSLSAALTLVTEKDAEVAAVRAETQNEADRLRRELEQAGAAKKSAEDARALAVADADALRRQIEAERTKAEAERKALVEEGRKEHDQVLATASSMRTSARNEREALATRLQALEAQTETLSTRTESAETQLSQTMETVRLAVRTVRRTPFVPPALRIAIDAIEPAVADPGTPPPGVEGRGHRILLLDRDSFGLGAVATELEAAGHHPLVAHFAEEVSFFFKTPESRRVGVAVCDVMALRSDQDLGALVRAWRQDVPHLAVFVTYNGESPMETERAQRLSLAAALPLLHRPLAAGSLVEAISSHIRRQGAPVGPRPA